jgi:hypothetical protein
MRNLFVIIRMLAVIVTFLGALFTAIAVLHTGRYNNSAWLMALFVAWDVSPFIAMIVAQPIFKRRGKVFHLVLYVLMMAISVTSLAFYSGLIRWPDKRPAFIFIVIPLVSWIIIGLVLGLSVLFDRKKTFPYRRP